MRTKTNDKEISMISFRADKGQADRFRKIVRVNNINMTRLMNRLLDEYLATTPTNEWGIIVEQGGSN